MVELLEGYRLLDVGETIMHGDLLEFNGRRQPVNNSIGMIIKIRSADDECHFLRRIDGQSDDKPQTQEDVW